MASVAESSTNKASLHNKKMFRCVICKDDDESSNLIQLRWKGSQGINKASKERCDTLETHAGEFVHEDCRHRYTNKLIIKSDLRKNTEEPRRSETPTLRSKSQFSFSEHCLFCGVTAKQDKRKGIEVFPVRTDDFKSKILKACDDI
ncbi:Hypothetical predicted protein [Mytilus galloprovincialis]|uniref:Uncharacterized protein n=1 Tax=Mytilus galloprovincialis TaxID=29158 RepID=A0A8B6D664_MYTGA|nr:Hypothetical predicted protein [Mytilus galloprovincialis]